MTTTGKIRDRQRAGSQVARAKRLAIIMASVIGTGVFGVLRAWQTHNFAEGFAVTTIFIVVLPTLILRSIKSRTDD
jgi:hypothetical protein